MADISRKKGRPRAFGGPGTQPTIQALDRALTVLDALAAADGLTLTELARSLNQSTATVHRILATLEARQVVEMDPAHQTWHIGAMAFRLGSAFLRRMSVVERSRDTMRELMQLTGETSNLGIERHGEVMFVSQVETQETIRAFFAPGTLSPMHASGIGKALLARYSEERLTRFLRRATLPSFTVSTITSPDALRADLERIRARGWALDDQEKTSGMRCVAAPILDVHGEAVAGISVSGPTQRMTEGRIGELGDVVRSAAEKLSLGLGAPIGA